MFICQVKDRFVQLEPMLEKIKKPKFDSFLFYIKHHLRRDGVKIEEKIEVPIEERHQSYIRESYSKRFHNIIHLMRATESQRRNEPNFYGEPYLDDLIFKIYKKENFFMAYSLSFVLDADESYGSLIINLLPISAMIDALEKVSVNPYIKNTENETKCKMLIDKIKKKINRADFLEINLAIKMKPIHIAFLNSIRVVLSTVLDLEPIAYQVFIEEIKLDNYLKKARRKGFQKRNKILNKNIKELKSSDLKDKRVVKLFNIEELKSLDFGLRIVISWAIIEILKKYDVFKDIAGNLLSILIENNLLRVIAHGFSDDLYIASVFYNKELAVKKVVTIEGFEGIKGVAVKIADVMLKNHSDFLKNYINTDREVLESVSHFGKQHGLITIRPITSGEPEIKVDIYAPCSISYLIRKGGFSYEEVKFYEYFLNREVIYKMFFA